MFRSKTLSVYIVFVSILQCAVVVLPADCKPKNFRTLQLLALKEMREAVIASQKADDVMLQEIDVVARELEREFARRVRRHAEPLSMRQLEEEALSKRLSSKIGANPYSKPEPQPGSEPAVIPKEQTRSDELGVQNSSSPFRPEQAHPVSAPGERVKVVLDYSISSYGIDELRKQMPEAWTSQPGRIMVGHNGYDLCLIWGGGVDGKPVFDRAKQRFKLVSIRVNPH